MFLQKNSTSRKLLQVSLEPKDKLFLNESRKDWPGLGPSNGLVQRENNSVLINNDTRKMKSVSDCRTAQEVAGSPTLRVSSCSFFWWVMCPDCCFSACRFSVVLSRDGMWGSPDENGSWTGLVLDLHEYVRTLSRSHISLAVLGWLFATQKQKRRESGIWSRGAHAWRLVLGISYRLRSTFLWD